jgi:PAS domain S-box-containing protein
MNRHSLQHSGALNIDQEAREVTIDGHPIFLTNAEYTLLATLTEHPRRAFSREYLTQALTDSEWVSDTHTLDTHVSRLRRKLGESGTEPRHVITVHGYGYRFEPDVAPHPTSAFASNSQGPSSDPALRSVFLLADVDRTIVWSSENIRDLLGWEPTDVQGTDIYQLVHPDDQPQVLNASADLDAGIPAAVVANLRTVSGDHHQVEALVRPIVAAESETVAVLGELRSAPGAAPDALPILEPIHVTTTLQNDAD